MDFELLNNVVNKNLECHYEINRKYSSQDIGTKIEYSELNFIQTIYKNKCQINCHKALSIYLNFKEAMNAPVTERIYQVEIKTDLFDYYLKQDNIDSWNFLAPLEPIFFNLTHRQQEIFTVVALKELQIDHEDEHGYSYNYKSTKHNYKDVLQSLLIVPAEMLFKFKPVFQIHPDIQYEVEKFFLHKKLDFELSDNKSSIKKIKI